MNINDQFVSVEEAAEISGLSTLTIRKRIKSGDIPHQRFGKVIIIPREKADEIKDLRKALGLRVAPPAPRGRPVKDQS